MPEPPAPSSKPVLILFPAVCLLGIAALIYFAHSAALASVPAYSTLNTNADGAKLLFEGLTEAGFVQVSRQFKSVTLQKPQQAAVFFLGVNPFRLTFAQAPYFDEMEKSANDGNRIIIAVTDEWVLDLSEAKSKSKSPTPLSERWGIRFVDHKDADTSSLDVGKTWKPLPEYGPDVWQRDFGKGNIIVVGRAQRLDNKGIASSEENRRLLRQLVSSYRSAVFEEAHLGIAETGSITGLARHYRLQGLVGGLILLAGLFVWNRSVSFPPALPRPEKSLLGADTRSMLTELMSRHLKGQLISTCVAEWNRTRAHAPALQMPEEGSAVAAYTKLQESLQNKTKFTI